MSIREPMLITALDKTQTIWGWSKETGINHTTLYHRFVTLGWDAERALSVKCGQTAYDRRRRAKSMARRRKVRQLFNEGLEPCEIAERMDKHIGMIWRDLRNMGLGEEDRILQRRRKVWQMVGTMSQTEMAREIGVSDATIHGDIKAVLANPSIVKPNYSHPCDCGEPVEHEVDIQIRTETHEKLYLCASCYDLFLEIESLR